MAPRTLVVLQPGYLPWLGFFDQMRRADAFIYYDDVQFDKHGWRNRNRVKAPDGRPHWLTVPVLHSGRNWPRILDVGIDNRTPWARKHVGTLRQFYSRAPHLERYLPELADAASSGRVFCDAYSPTGEPCVRTLDQAGRIVFAGAANGSGYRLAPAIASEAADLLHLGSYA